MGLYSQSLNATHEQFPVGMLSMDTIGTSLVFTNPYVLISRYGHTGYGHLPCMLTSGHLPDKDICHVC